MTNIVKTGRDPSENCELYLCNDRVFIIKSLGFRGSRLYEQIGRDRVFRVVCWDNEVTAEALIANFLEVEASTACNVPSTGGKRNVHVQKQTDWKNAKPAASRKKS